MDDSMAEKTHQPTVIAPASPNDEAASPTQAENGVPKVLTSNKLQSWITISSCYLANFSDGFQNNLASNTNVILKHMLGSKVYNSEIQTRISNAVIVGAIIGVIVFGYTADMYSRRTGLFFTSAFVAIGSLMAALTFQVSGTTNMLWYLIVVRGIAGFGVGGEYPPSASAGLEEGDENLKKYRGPLFVSFTTLMATTGGPICTLIYYFALLGSSNNLRIAFHTIYSVATVLPILILLLRTLTRDSTLFHHSNFRNHRRPPYLLLLRRYWRRLLLTSTAFFLYDFINFPNSIMSSTLISSLVKDSSVRETAKWQIVLSILPIPGVIVGAFLTNLIGRRLTGILGFTGYIILGFFIGGFYPSLSLNIPAFVVLYGLMQAFGHGGPGATIGLISSELYPTAARGMCYAISTAFGRAGAAIGTEVFLPIEDAAGKRATFYVAGGIGVLGVVVYWFIPESRDLDLEREDGEFRAWLADRGYDMGGGDGEKL